MKRFARHLFTFCAAVSLLLCVAVCVVWVRSYSLTDQLVWQRVDGLRFVQTARGCVWGQMNRMQLQDFQDEDFGLRYRRFQVVSPPNYLFSYTSPSPLNVASGWRWGGFAWYTLADGDDLVIATGVARCSSIAIVAAIVPLAWAAPRVRSVIRRRRRRRLGLCLSCGYDIRASPERCPECGNAATVRAPVATVLA